jgi:hypothetical protein
MALKTMEEAMVQIVTEGTAEEVNGVRAEMIKTLPFSLYR